MKYLKQLFVFVYVVIGFSGFSQSGFNQIRVIGKIEVTLNQDSETKIIFKEGEKFADYVTNQVKDSMLIIKMLKKFPPDYKVILKVTYEKLNSIETFAGAKIYNTGTVNGIENIKSTSGSDIDIIVQSDSLSVKVKSGGFVRLTGEANDCFLKVKTSGLINAVDCKINKLDAEVNGGKVAIKTTGELNAKVLFKGLLTYMVKPEMIVENLKFGGQIKLEEEF